jgi:ribosomal protein L18
VCHERQQGVGDALQVMRQLEEYKIKAQEADEERAQAVGLMIQEKEKARMACEACDQVPCPTLICICTRGFFTSIRCTSLIPA